jgi:uncharacterized membrane protein
MEQHTPTSSGITMTQWTWIVYCLQIIGFFTGGLTNIIGLIVNIIKRDDAKQDPMLDTHFRWQIRTFVWSLAWTVIGFCTIWLFVGFIILGVAFLWSIYRPIKGMIRLSEDKMV